MSVFAVANLRDLAGVRLGRGRMRAEQLYRADDVSTVDADGARALQDRGIRHVFDLRGVPEQEITGRGPLEAFTGYDHLPFVLSPASDPARPSADELDSAASAPLPALSPEAVGRWYLSVTLDSADVIIRGLDSLSRVEGAAVFHCAAGKDRTGIFAASVLSVLGAPDEEIVADYHASEEHLERVFDRLRAAPYGFFLENIPHAGALLRAEKDTMRAFLSHADRDHGGLVELLSARGLQKDSIDQLRARLID